MIEIKHLSFGYVMKDNILKDISFHVKDGELLSILGPNGTGKTTLLRCILGFLHVKSGTICVNGINLTKMSQKKMAQMVAYVPQSFSEMGLAAISVIDTVLMGRMPYIRGHYDSTDYDKVFQLLKEMDLERLAFRRINQLSGGERQRVFVARAIVQEPKIILMDEPTSSLDMRNQLIVLRTIDATVKRKGISVIMTMHDINLASLFSEKLLMLKDGKTYAHGLVQNVLTKENIYAVYGVETNISIDHGVRYVHLQK